MDGSRITADPGVGNSGSSRGGREVSLDPVDRFGATYSIWGGQVRFGPGFSTGDGLPGEEFTHLPAPNSHFFAPLCPSKAYTLWSEEPM